jgi:ribosomal protein S14
MINLFNNSNKRNICRKVINNIYVFNYLKFFLIINILNIQNIQIEPKILYLILKNNYNLFFKYNFKSYYHDISFLSGRTKSLICNYGLARTDFKRLMTLHQIPNLKKASW